MGGVSFGQTTVTDELTFSSLGGKQGSVAYADFSGKSLTSSAVYAGNYASTNSLNCIQIRSKNSNSGIVVTTFGGTIKSIEVEFDAKSTNTLDIYGKNTAYTSASDLYDSSKQGTKIGSANKNATITPTASYNYIGFRSNNGAIYISKITIEWETGSSDKTSTKLSFGTDYDGKTVSTKVGEMLKTPATLTPVVSGATISYDSSDKTVAEIDKDGVVYAYKEGTTTITASYAGDDTYAASSASYTLNVEDVRTATTLTFPISSYTFDLGSGDQEFTNAAILNPAGAGTITYKSSNEDLAIVLEDGSVAVATDKVGTATITATFAGNDNYKASEASYTIEVKALQEAFDLTDPAAYGYAKPATSKGTDIAEGETLVSGDVTITNIKNNSKTSTRFWNNNDKITFRVYSDALLLISVPAGYAINSITTSPNSKNYSLTGLNTNKVTMDVTSSINFTAMTVTYAKLPTATLTTAASGFSTYAADYAVNYTEAGLKAYAVKVSDDKTKVAYTECTGVVPAGKAVLVKGTASTSYSLTPATEDADATFDTDLQVSDGNVTADGITIFAFGTKNDVSGFKIVKSGVVIPAKKGYLVVENASAAKDFFAFEDSTNGIDDPTIGIGEEEVPLFNLAGQRVGKDYKGIVVKNGKKYVNK